MHYFSNSVILWVYYPVKTEKSYDPKFVTDELALDTTVASLIAVLFLDHDLCYGAAALAQRLRWWGPTDKTW